MWVLRTWKSKWNCRNRDKKSEWKRSGKFSCSRVAFWKWKKLCQARIWHSSTFSKLSMTFNWCQNVDLIKNSFFDWILRIFFFFFFESHGEYNRKKLKFNEHCLIVIYKLDESNHRAGVKSAPRPSTDFASWKSQKSDFHWETQLVIRDSALSHFLSLSLLSRRRACIWKLEVVKNGITSVNNPPIALKFFFYSNNKARNQTLESINHQDACL